MSEDGPEIDGLRHDKLIISLGMVDRTRSKMVFALVGYILT